MFAQINYPEKLLPEQLDEYLTKGWFRMRQTIFTTNFLHFNEQFYPAIWLRVGLQNSIPDKKQLTLHKLNKGFSTEIKKAGNNLLTAPHEKLYQLYSQSLSFEISPSLHKLLLGNEFYNRFNTYIVNIYDRDTLIAAGFFDLGKNSAAGIACIYHPAYKKYSLGKYLMFLKMDYCKQQQLQYFYPGYVVPGYTPFDYKLEIGKATLEYLQLSTRQWVTCTSISTIQNPLQDMVENLTGLHTHLLKNKIPNTILHYKFFEINLDPYYFDHELFDFPVFLYCFPSNALSFYSIIVYDTSDAKYCLLQCSAEINIGYQQDGNTVFDACLLKIDRQLFTTAIPGEMSSYLSGILKT